jgi:hypothetical protein
MNSITILVMTTLALLLASCAPSLQASRVAGSVRVNGTLTAASVERCEQLSDRAQTWGAVSQGSAAVAAGSSLSIIPVRSHDARIGLAVTAAVAGAVAATATALEQSSASEWARECSQ